MSELQYLFPVERINIFKLNFSFNCFFYPFLFFFFVVALISFFSINNSKWKDDEFFFYICKNEKCENVFYIGNKTNCFSFWKIRFCLLIFVDRVIWNSKLKLCLLIVGVFSSKLHETLKKKKDLEGGDFYRCEKFDNELQYGRWMDSFELLKIVYNILATIMNYQNPNWKNNLNSNLFPII